MKARTGTNRAINKPHTQHAMMESSTTRKDLPKRLLVSLASGLPAVLDLVGIAVTQAAPWGLEQLTKAASGVLVACYATAMVLRGVAALRSLLIFDVASEWIHVIASELCCVVKMSHRSGFM